MSAETVIFGSQSKATPAANTGLNFNPATRSRSAAGAVAYGLSTESVVKVLPVVLNTPVAERVTILLVSHLNVFTRFCADTPKRNPGIFQDAPRSTPKPEPDCPVFSEAVSVATYGKFTVTALESSAEPASCP